MSGGREFPNEALPASATPESLAQMYLSLDQADLKSVATFAGPGKLARVFAALPTSTKDAIAASLTQSQADVFREPLVAIPLAPEEQDQLKLLAVLIDSLLRRRSFDSTGGGSP